VINESPTAGAGPNQTVNYAQTVTLNGAGSSDPEGGVLAYAWTLNGVQIATGANPAVGPFDIGSHAITLTVTDDHGATATDSMVIYVVNEAPVANAGPDQTVGIRKGKTALAILDGTASTDPESGALSYVWTLDGQTIGTEPSIQAALSRGIHTIELTVTDEHGATASDSVIVTVAKGGSS
jgi:PKD repeat protein